MNIAHIASNKDYNHYDLASVNPNSGKWELDFINIQAFFINRGYFIYRTSVDKHIFIRIIDNIVQVAGKKDLKDELLTSIEEEGNRYQHQFFLKNIAKALSDEFLETLPSKKVEFKKDTKDAMQLYYRNCIVKITKDDIKAFGYEKLNGYIWESQIIQRDFNMDAIIGSDFKTFCWNISNKETARYNSIRSSLGFIIHNYKNPAYCPATILNDEVISNHPEGGTGKGILIKALEQCIKVLTIDGKTFTFDKNFLYQRVTAETRFICFQDVNKTFDFERCFSILTEGIVTEKKGKDELFLSFSDSPKVGITTNYGLRGSGNSHERRRNELEISQYYNKNKTPLDEFNKMLFDDWETKDWNEFDMFIADSCQLYLKNGIIAQTLINLPEKKLMAETSSEFIEFMEDSTPSKGNNINRSTFYDNFKRENPTSKIAAKTFYVYVRLYSDFHNLNVTEGKTNGIRYFSF